MLGRAGVCGCSSGVLHPEAATSHSVVALETCGRNNLRPVDLLHPVSSNRPYQRKHGTPRIRISRHTRYSIAPDDRPSPGASCQLVASPLLWNGAANSDADHNCASHVVLTTYLTPHHPTHARPLMTAGLGQLPLSGFQYQMVDQTSIPETHVDARLEPSRTSVLV